MSFYWQQALQQQQQQNTGQQEPQFQNQPQQTTQQGQWDYINLGGAPVQQYQWNQGGYQHQQQPQQQQPQQQQPTNGNQWNQQAVQVEHTPMLQQQKSSKETTPEVSSTTYYQPQYSMPNLANVSAPPSKETTPESNYSYQQPSTWQGANPTNIQMSFLQQQNFGSSHEPTPERNIPSKEPTPETTYLQQQPSYSAPLSKETTPAPHYQKETTPIQYQVPSKNVSSKETSHSPQAHLQPECGFAQNFQSMDLNTTVIQLPVENQQFSVPTQEKPLTVESQQTTATETKVTPSSSEDDWEKADMEVQAAVEEDTSNDAVVVQAEENSRESSLGDSWSNEPAPQVDDTLRQETPDTKTVMNFSNSPGDAQATSTPKESEKRSTTVQKPVEPSKIAEVPTNNLAQDMESGNNSDSTIASTQQDLQRGSIRDSYRNYKQHYSDILKRLNGYQSDKYRPDFRPSSKLKNPLLVAAGISGPTRNNITRTDGRISVPLPQSQSFNGDAYSETGSQRRHRVSRLEDGRSSVRHQTSYGGYSASNQSSSGQHDLRRYQGRYSVMGIPYRDNYHHNVPQRNYEPEYMEGSSLSESEDEEGSGASDYEVREYNMGMHNQSAASQHQYGQPPNRDGPELYYFGVVNLSKEVIRRMMKYQPPPQDYYRLPPMEKAAYMYYAAVYKTHYKDINQFHERFNREYYKYVCEGDPADAALYKVCKSIQDQYTARQRERQKQASYEASQRQLQSDETSQDGQSESASQYDTDDMVANVSAGLFYKGPAKFSSPHAFLTFGVGGQTVLVQPEKSISVVYIDDVKTHLRDSATLRVHDMLYSFKGPLIPNQSPAHNVRLFISKQIEAIKRSDVAMENRYASDVVESLLVWQLLEMLVKQHGNITGPDIAELLLSASKFTVNTQVAPQTPDVPAALGQFTSCLLGGHVDEAVECAIRHGLFADALVLTRRLYPNDPQKIHQIEERFLQTRSMNNPVNTLVSVANGIIPPVITDPLLDDWRTHAAIILANLNQKEAAMNTMYQLARSLRDRDYHSAADFCFMVVCIMAGIDPFVPVKETNGDGFSANISLVHSAIPDDDEFTLELNQNGFLITDLQATEIFDYALRLKPERGESPLTRCVDYQTSRMTYAKLLATHGLAAESYRYCVDIARAVWNNYTSFKMEDLIELCDLAESLHHLASVDSSEIGWISQLRTMCQALLFPTPTEPYREEIPVVQQIKTEPVEEVPVVVEQTVQQAPVEEQNLVDWNTAPIISETKKEPEIVEQHMTARTHQPQPQPPVQQDDTESVSQQLSQEPLKFEEPTPIEQEVIPPPTLPPSLPVGVPPVVTNAAPTGLRAVRGASRYANVGVTTSTTAPTMTAPTSFGFIPQPQESDDAFDPFSGQANPTIQQNSARLPSDE